ncbi:MAG: serine hydrolase domain-containing protein [Pseudomonadota bacterium]
MNLTTDNSPRIPLRLCAVLLLVWPVLSTANTNVLASNAIDAWESWTKKTRISDSTIVISYKGEVVASSEKNRSIDAPYPVASLSKAITGICATQYLEDSEHTTASTIGDVVGDRLSSEKIKQWDKKQNITIKQLLNQTSGIKKDITQKKSLNKTPDFGTPNVDTIALRWIKQKQKGKAGGDFIYNNGHYAMLGLIIETLSGKDYEMACLEKTLRPAGIGSAELNPEWRIMSSWGGWKISAVDYLKFVNHYFSPRKVDGKRPQRFGMGFVSDAVRYGAGFFWRNTRSGNNYWHFGRWRWDGGGRYANFGAYFVYYASEWAVSVNYNKYVDRKTGLKLDKALWQALHP